MNAAFEFCDAISAAGLTPPEHIEADGELHRFASNGKRDDDAGWYVLHANGIAAGAFGDWRTGISMTWKQEIGRKLAPIEAQELSRRIADAKAKRQADEAKRNFEARERAMTRWKAAKRADPAHPYLVAKDVQGHGIRQEGDELVIPVRDVFGELHSLQTITPDGDKRFLAGGRVAGCYFGIGKPTEVLCIAEGYATGASIHDATGHAVAVAFNASNLEPVAKALRAKYAYVRIVFCADDDYRTEGNPGITKASEAARAVGGWLAIPDFGEGRPDGATDFNDLARHSGTEAVERAVANARAPEAPEHQPEAPDAPAAILVNTPWPEALDDAAFHGIAGELMRMIEPDSESDPAAILVQVLVAFGALVGRGPHVRVEADEHHANLYAVMIGTTSKGRKGTSWSRVRDIFKRVPGWKPEVNGLVSGEGVKYHVRDPREETKRNKNGELLTELVDAGIDDKRLLAMEPEFASVLRAAQRSGNTLSATVRVGWDSGNFQSLTKNDPVIATGAHVAIIGHITANELRAELTATDSANGFANRFLFVAIKRSKLLPFGGAGSDPAVLDAFAVRLQRYAELARTRQRISMTDAAKAAWIAVYPALSAGGDGLHGAVTARAEAQVIRVALVYCLLDGAAAIDSPHLLAALAVWTYCDATAKCLFGTSLGDRIADQIMRHLDAAGNAGLTRNDLRDALGRNVPSERIGAALDLLERRGRVRSESVTTGGRPAEVWRAAG